MALFDVDGTLSLSRLSATPETLAMLAQLRASGVTIGFVGGSDLVKQKEQLGENCLDLFDYCFAENGLIAYRRGVELPSQSFINSIGEEKYQKLVNHILRYLADLEIPVKRGTFVEFRRGMINVSPIGRNCSQEERMAFDVYDAQHGIRKALVQNLKANFDAYKLQFAIGGQISIDIFPQGWDKTYCLRHLADEHFTEIHFFGDKTFPGGNDYEIYHHPGVIGHTVTGPDDTMKQVEVLFLTNPN